MSDIIFLNDKYEKLHICIFYLNQNNYIIFIMSILNIHHIRKYL